MAARGDDCGDSGENMDGYFIEMQKGFGAHNMPESFFFYPLTASTFFTKNEPINPSTEMMATTINAV